MNNPVIIFCKKFSFYIKIYRIGSYIRINFIKQSGDDGIEYICQDSIKKQRSVLSYMLSKMGQNLFLGKSIMNISLPIYIFEERSMLDAMAFPLRLLPYFSGHDYKDPIERLKMVTAYNVASAHLGLSNNKPFNPILGETFQCKIKDIHMYLEQTSHHPPIYNYYSKHPKYTGFGYYEIDSYTGANSVDFNIKGKFFTKYYDGVVHSSSFPKFVINGVMMGRRLFSLVGNFVIQDLTNNLIACIKCNPDERGYFGKMFKSKSTFPDYIKGFIANFNNVKYDNKTDSYICDKKNILSYIEGEWSNHLKIDDRVIWEQGTYPLFPIEKLNYTLPSDSLIRDDLLFLKAGYVEQAQQAKINLEERQRNDKKLREKYKNYINKK